MRMRFSVRRVVVSVPVLLAWLITASDVAFADPYTFTALNEPNALNGVAAYNGINNAGQVVGWYNDATGYHGFFESKGVYTTLNAPGGVEGTFAQSINNLGQIAGWYTDSTGNDHGFVESGGVYTTIDKPGVTSTQFYGINDSGQLSGVGFKQGVGSLGFLYSGGSYTTILVPGSSGSGVWGLNNAAQVVGFNGNDGYIEQGGAYTLFQVPGANSGTYARGVNNSGEVVGGYYVSYPGNPSSFTYQNGVFNTITVPGAVNGSQLYGVNDSGQLLGSYKDATGYHGFIATPSVVPEPYSLTILGVSSLLMSVYYFNRRQR